MPNDTCATAIDVTSLLPYSAAIDTSGFADPAVTPSCPNDTLKKAAWFKVSNSTSAAVRITVNVRGVNYEAVFSVWRGTCAALVEVDTVSNGIDFDDDDNPISENGFTLPAGDTRYILVADDDPGTGGTLHIAITEVTSFDGCIVRDIEQDSLFEQAFTVHTPAGAIIAREFSHHCDDAPSPMTGGWLSQRSSDGHIFRFNTTFVWEYDHLMGYVQRWGSSTLTDPDAIYPVAVGSPYFWEPTVLRCVGADLFVGWSANDQQPEDASIDGQAVVQRRASSDLSLTTEWVLRRLLSPTTNAPYMPRGITPAGDAAYLAYRTSPGDADVPRVFKHVFGETDPTIFATGGTDQQPFGTIWTRSGMVVVLYITAPESIYSGDGTIVLYTEAGVVTASVDFSLGALSGYPGIALEPSGAGVWLMDATHLRRYSLPGFTITRDVTLSDDEDKSTTGLGDLVIAAPPSSTCQGLTLSSLVPVDCATGVLRLTGTGFAHDTTFTIRDPAGHVLPHQVLSFSSTTIVFRTAITTRGEYCVSASNPLPSTGSGPYPPIIPPQPPSDCPPLTPGMLPALAAAPWFEAALIAAGATKCWSEPKFLATEGAANARGFMMQRGQLCNTRARYHEAPFLDIIVCDHPACSCVMDGSCGINHDTEHNGFWHWT